MLPPPVLSEAAAAAGGSLQHLVQPQQQQRHVAPQHLPLDGDMHLGLGGEAGGGPHTSTEASHLSLPDMWAPTCLEDVK